MRLDYSQCRNTPYDVQRTGIEALVRWNDPPSGRVYGGCFALFDEMGVGKTKQVIDAAQFLLSGDPSINRVIVVAPASVRSVWFDEELGELQKHLWDNVSALITLYHKKILRWQWGPTDAKPDVRWVITNYDFIRRAEHLQKLLELANERTLLVLDESSAVKTHNSQQTKACLKLRQRCGRVVLLNGTPIANNPGDLYAQMNIMDARIFGVKTWYHFRARYGVLGGFQNKQIIGWRNLDDLQRRVKPYVLRRLTTDSLELPKKYDPVRIEVPLEAKTWRAYREMRDEMVAWLSSDLMVTAPAAGVKVIRLAQMTSGFVGGVEDLPENLAIETEDDLVTTKPNNEGVIEIGTEKHYAFLQWLKERMDRYEWNHKILVWSRFRSEVKRLHFAVGSLYPTIHRGLILGGQHRNDRRDALRLLDPRTSPKGPVVVIGTPASGSMGLNCTAAWTMVYLSNDFNLKTRIQSMARTHRAGQTHDCEYYDFVATGPNGQKTIDHQILKALDSKSNLASWTAAAWRTALMEE